MSNTTTWQNPMMTPLDGCKDPNIVLVQLAIGRLLSSASYYYVLRLRGEKPTIWTMIFYLIVPLGPLFWHVFAIAAIFTMRMGDPREEWVPWAILLLRLFPEGIWGICGYVATLFMVCSVLPPDFSNLENKRNAQRVLRWSMGLGVVLEKDAAEEVATFDAAAGTKGSPRMQRSIWQITGNILLPTALITLGVVTVAIYLRSWWRGTNTVEDKRLFELACSIILSAIYWIGYTVDIPPFTKPAARAREEQQLINQAKTNMETVSQSITDYPADLNRTIIFYIPALILRPKDSITEILYDEGMMLLMCAMVAAKSVKAYTDANPHMSLNLTEATPPTEDRVNLGIRFRMNMASACTGASCGFVGAAGFIMPLGVVAFGAIEMFFRVKDLEQCSGQTLSRAALGLLWAMY